MAFDWLKSLRVALRSAPRRAKPVPPPDSLEVRTLLSVTPVDTAFSVDPDYSDQQSSSVIAMDDDGDYVVAWQCRPDGSYEIHALRFNSAGVPQGEEFQVNTYYSSSQTSPAVAMDSDGDFVVAWASSSQDGNGSGIYAQRYSALGVPQGGEFLVNTWTTGSQSSPSVAMDSSGDFVVTWVGSGQAGTGIYAQRYNSAGVPQGIEFHVNTLVASSLYDPAVAMDAAGDFVITWTNYFQDGSGSGIYAQRYNAAGTPQGGEFRVNTWTTGNQSLSSVAMDAAGDFVVTWQSAGQDGYGNGVYAQRYNAAGVPQGSEFLVNTITSSQEETPVVAMDSVGNFVISWRVYVQFNVYNGLYARRYDAAGVPDGLAFIANPQTIYRPSLPAIAMDSDGDFAITWLGSQSIDGTGLVYVRQFSVDHAPTAISLSNHKIEEGGPVIKQVGTFSTSDANSGDTFTYTLVTGTGDTDNDRFSITGDTLKTRDLSLFEHKSNFSIRVRSTDQTGRWVETSFDLELTPLTAEFRVNSATIESQSSPAIAMNGEGSYVIAWESFGQDGDQWGIYAQRYNAQGVAIGNEFRVNSYTTNNQRNPSVAMDSAGDFVISWESYGQDGSRYGIYAQRFNSLGILQGGEFQVNTDTFLHQWYSAVAMDADGDFVITWRGGPGILAQRYNSNGLPLGGEFCVNTTTTTQHRDPAIAMDADGDFVIAWASYRLDGSRYGVYAQRYNSAGTPSGSEFLVNTVITHGDQFFPAVAMDVNGDFVISWTSRGVLGEVYDSDYGIAAKRYNSLGVPQGTDFLVNSTTTGIQSNSSVAIDQLGNFVITWHSFRQDGSGYGIEAQRFNAAGLRIDGEFQVNSYTRGNQWYPAIAADDQGHFVIAWNSYWNDGSVEGIFARSYASILNSAPVVNNAGAPTLDPLLQNQSLATNNGTLVSDIIARMGPSGGITDPNGNPLGIAINGVSNTYGSWQYTVNGGTNWAPITVTGNSNALLLAADGNTRIRFLPNANFIGQSIFAFVAWDRTSGANGGTANVSSRGGTTAFSLGYEIATINVNNAAPVLNNAGTPTLDPIPQNVYGVDNVGTLVSDIIARMGPFGGITDPNPGALQGIAINGLGNTGTGDWQYTTNGGASWHLIGTTGNANARLLAADPNTRIRYVPQVGYQGTAIFSFVAWDRTSGGNGAVVSVGTRGGTTPYSTDFDYASISIVNSAPVLNDAGNPLLDGILPNIPDVSNPGTLVSDLIYRMYPVGGITDANPYALRGIAIIGKSGSGTWEFSTNNGSSWSTINATGGANALLLASDANTRVRYRPATNFIGEAKIAFVAWDQSSGSNGATANASTRGGSTAFSTTYEYASIFVNTAPTLNNAGTPTLDSISNTLPVGSNMGILVTDLLNRMGSSGGITDPDPAALKGLAIIGQNGTSTGSWQYSTNGGTSWLNVNTTGSVNALLLASDSQTRIRYVPNVGFTGTVAIAFAAWDRTQWLNGSIVNAGARGGATPFSTDYDLATITVTA